VCKNMIGGGGGGGGERDEKLFARERIVFTEYKRQCVAVCCSVLQCVAECVVIFVAVC